jgi:hypothetical protein
MVTRVRIDAEGESRDEVETHLNAAFQLLFQNSVSTHFTFVGSGFTSQPFGPVQVVPRASEMVEEVYETDIQENGGIHWKGRRVLRFFGGPENHWAELAEEIIPLETAPAPMEVVDHGPPEPIRRVPADLASFSVGHEGQYIPGDIGETEEPGKV